MRLLCTLSISDDAGPAPPCQAFAVCRARTRRSHLKFMSAVKISALLIESPDPDKAPTSIRLFVNKLGLDFDSAKSEAPTQEIILHPSDTKRGFGKQVETRFVLFQARRRCRRRW